MKNVEKWTSYETSFLAKVQIDDAIENEVDVIFTHESGAEIVMPAFWDGGFTWRVRFAPNKIGIWNYVVKEVAGCELGISGIKGAINCVEYAGEYEIYKRGFLKTEPNVRYFMYDDGTPFFYLGDTHWRMPMEEFDEKGSHAVDIETDSHFKYIVDKRVEQKFNVYQSEPLGFECTIYDGIGEDDILEFQRFDEYFKYIAQKGLVHANAQYIFPSGVKEKFFEEEFQRKISRYWIARYASYPVLWTLGQEVDRCFFGKCGMTAENNPYKLMCKYLYQYDPYKHPITGHQENAMLTGAKGDAEYNIYSGKNVVRTDKNKQSAFYGMSEHTWWGIQWRPDVHVQHNFNIPKDYWYTGEGKVSINYETRYDYLYTKNFGARANGWISVLNGIFGYGYGAADMWAYKLTYSFNVPSSDGVDTVYPPEKYMPWGIAINMPTGDHLTKFREFFESFEWWKLVPDFDEGNAFQKTEKEGFYTAAHIGNEKYIVYLYNRDTASAGKLVNMDENAEYLIQWFNTRTGEYTVLEENYKGAEYDLPEKPDYEDYALVATKKQEVEPIRLNSEH